MPEVATTDPRPGRLVTDSACLLDEATRLLAAGGIVAPRREAVRIWRDVLGSEPALALGPVPAEDSARFRAAIARRAAGEPLAYVTGVTGFRHLTLAVDRRALIPRPETEGLVDHVLARVRSGVVADAGTGTGCLALSLRQEGAFERVLAIDASRDALALARKNRAATGLAIDLVRGDLLECVADASLDAVVSNPPYLTAAEYAALDPAVKAWEPASALVSGEDGMAATDRLLRAAGRVLRPGAWLVLEVDCGRASVAARHAAEAGLGDVAVFDDLFGRARYLVARRSDAP
ncbi:MAG: peptide chain release factor N(5)-glutamine methyltransferase [Gemmatimonadota bacterium]